MAKLLFLSLLLLSSVSLSLSCNNDVLTGGRTFQRCLDLDALDASIHWTYFPANGTASIAFKVESNGWAAWGPNPASSRMVGTQAFIALINGTGASAFTTSLDSKGVVLAPGSITVKYADLSAERKNGDFIIYVKITLPENKTTINHTWQTGEIGSNGVLLRHPFDGDHLKAYGTLDLLANAAPAGTPGGTPGTPSGTPGTTPPRKNAADVGRKMGFASYLLVAAGISSFFF